MAVIWGKGLNDIFAIILPNPTSVSPAVYRLYARIPFRNGDTNDYKTPSRLKLPFYLFRGAIRITGGGFIEDPPVDSITYTNIVYLRQNDRIYIKKPDETRTDNSILYDNGAESAHFSGMLLVRDQSH